MTIRSQQYTLLIDSTFRLESSRRALDRGLYHIETETELMQGDSFQAERWLFTTIRPVDAQGRTRRGEIYEMTPAELKRVLTCHASTLQSLNAVGHIARQPCAPTDLDRRDIERACNEGMAQHG